MDQFTLSLVLIFLSAFGGVLLGVLLMWSRERSAIAAAFRRGGEEMREKLDTEKNELARSLGENLLKMRDSLSQSVCAYQGAVEALIGQAPSQFSGGQFRIELEPRTPATVHEISPIETDVAEENPPLNTELAELDRPQLEVLEDGPALPEVFASETTESNHRLNGVTKEIPSVS